MHSRCRQLPQPPLDSDIQTDNPPFCVTPIDGGFTIICIFA